VWERYGDRLARFVEAGLLVREPADGAAPAGTLRLSPRGLLLSNEVMISFIDAKGTVE
jgi:hypothetical protein